MTDYHPLIARAVEGLDKSTGEARRALYERARTALVTQLRAVEPALSESEITKERLALEDAIRKVEAEAARKSRTEPRAGRSAAARARKPARGRSANRDDGRAARHARQTGRPTPGDSGARRVRRMQPTARERLLSARSSAPSRERIKGFRDGASEGHDLGGATAKAAQSTRDTRDSFGLVSSHPMPSGEEAAGSSLHDGFQPQLDADELISSSYSSRQRRSRELADEHAGRAAGDAAIRAAAAPRDDAGRAARAAASAAFLSRPDQAPGGADRRSAARRRRFRGSGPASPGFIRS